jgi:ligand-binding sensor domain-containing protein
MRFIFGFICLLLSLLVNASGPSVQFERLTTKDGLSQNSIYAMVQDKEGFLWIGTLEGLNRYDGYELKVYRKDALDDSTLGDNSITALFEDSKGTLWVGTTNGLSKYDRKHDRFVRYLDNDGDVGSQAHNNIRAIDEDSRGILWIATYGGVKMYDLTDGY